MGERWVLFFVRARGVARFDWVSPTISLEILDRHNEALFEFLWCPVCGHGEFTHIPFEGVFCTNCNTQVVLQQSHDDRGHEEAVLACFDTESTWNLRVAEKLRRDLPDGSARAKILDEPGAYEVDWWSPEPDDHWEPVERGEFDDVEEPEEVSHLA
jgi:hypothetical protein